MRVPTGWSSENLAVGEHSRGAPHSPGTEARAPRLLRAGPFPTSPCSFVSFTRPFVIKQQQRANCSPGFHELLQRMPEPQGGVVGASCS